jgi:hypothetical protein
MVHLWNIGLRGIVTWENSGTFSGAWQLNLDALALVVRAAAARATKSSIVNSSSHSFAAVRIVI